MRNLILLTLFFIVGVSLNAQDFTEVVYLKNGNMIRGTIVQMNPSTSLQIKSGDGKIYTYQMSEVKQIVKIPVTDVAATPSPTTVAPVAAEPVATTAVAAAPVSSTTTTYPKASATPVGETAEPVYVASVGGCPMSKCCSSKIRGYRGFFDFGYTLNLNDQTYDVSSLDRLEATTSHGYQFNPYLYLGVGGGVSYFHNNSEDEFFFPVFINPRVNLGTGKVVPFLDLKGGYSFGDEIEGIYISPSLGARFALPRGAINLGMAYTYQKTEILVENDYGYGIGHINLGGLTLRLGYEF